jgi:hypothetical protein
MGIETWKRAFIALTLGGAVFLGYLIFANQPRVFDALDALTRARPLPRMVRLVFRHDLQLQAERLLAALQPNAMAVTIWSVALLENTQALEADAVMAELQTLAQQYEATRWQNPLPFFLDNPRVNLLLVGLIRGYFGCDDSRELWTILQRLAMREVCVIGIPSYGSPLVGFIAVAFRDPLDAGERERVRVALQVASARAIAVR